ncbi:MAG: DUF4175 domain-containing protein [Alphaproteobacteria bacterium]
MTFIPPFDDPRPWLQTGLRRAWAVLAWERVWRASWAAVSLGGVFGAVALLDGLPRLSGEAHAAVLAGFALVFLGLLGWGWWGMRLPTRADAVRRLEQGGGQLHRPVSALDDRLAAGGDSAESRALWRAHLIRMEDEARRLRVDPPAPGVAALDPLGLRAVPVLLLVIGLAAAWGHVPERLSRALHPAWAASVATASSVRLWITPPDYTGLRPIVLEADVARSGIHPTDAAVSIPVGSAVLALVHGRHGGVPTLVVDGRVTPFGVLGDGSYRLETAIDGGGDGSLAVERDGNTLARWGITVVGDASPTIAFATPPADMGRWRLRLEYQAADDHGLAAVGALMEREGGQSGGTVSELPLPLPGSRPKVAHAIGLLDLTAHPWAGLPVVLRPFARDDRGQTGVGAPAEVTLPERVFTHPVAQAIVQQRRILLNEPEKLGQVIAALDAIALDRAAFNHDIVVHLALRTARNRIGGDLEANGRDGTGIGSVRDILWQTALRLEDGETAIAERLLDDAGKALSEALSRGDTGAAELERLIEGYREAMEQYLAAMARRLGKMEGRLPIPPGQMLRADALTAMLERMRDLARAGSREAARRMLGEMQQMMQVLRSARLPDQMQEAMREVRALMDGLKELIDRQQGLLDQTFRQSRETRRTVDRERLRASARDQDALRRDLAAMMEKLAETSGGALPDNLGRAEIAMREAAEKLTAGDAAKAAEAQSRALGDLKEGSRAALRQMMERLMAGGGGPALFPGADPGTDPLGRGSAADDGSVVIPTQPETRSAREILDELRRRAAEPGRPPAELDYLNRLLRQF